MEACLREACLRVSVDLSQGLRDLSQGVSDSSSRVGQFQPCRKVRVPLTAVLTPVPLSVLQALLTPWLTWLCAVVACRTEGTQGEAGYPRVGVPGTSE